MELPWADKVQAILLMYLGGEAVGKVVMTKKSQKQQGATGSPPPADPAEGFSPLLGALRQLIADSRQQVLRAVDAVQVQTYWHVGRHLVEFEQGGAQRAAYGQRLLPQLGQARVMRSASTSC